MSSEQPRRARESGGAGSSPIGSTAAIIIAIVAVVAGFLILRSINDDDGGTTVGGGDPTATTVGAGVDGSTAVGQSSVPGETAAPTTASPAPTTIAPVTTGATVVVANASSVNGAAGQYTTALEAKGFTMGTATDASGADLAQSLVYYDASDAAAQQVAAYLASLLGGLAVEAMPTPPPVAGGTLESGVTVVLMLGSDRAGKTLEQAASAGSATTIPGAATSSATTTAP